MNFERIRYLREEQELTQKDMANILGVTRSAYSLWEINKNTIPLQKLNDLCNYFNTSMDYIINRNNDLNTNKNFVKKNLDKKEIGIRIKQTRKKMNYTQEKLAAILNTTHSAISAYENGNTMIPTLFLIEIVKLSNVSMDWICGRTE